MIFFKKNISTKINKKNGINDPKKTNCTPVAIATIKPIKKIYLFAFFFIFCFSKYRKTK